jgi:chitin synthase
MILKYQKYLVMLVLFMANALLSITFGFFHKHWYAYIFILALTSLLNSFSSILLLLKKIFSNKKINDLKRSLNPTNYVYVIPCYNESEEELTHTINSVVLQRTVKNDKNCMVIVCDGKVLGSGNILSTDQILLQKILNNNFLPKKVNYTTWDNQENTLEIYTGDYTFKNNTMKYILIVKNINYGKRDSLVLVRKLCYNYNRKNINDSMISLGLFHHIEYQFDEIFAGKIKYIIGVDADTVLDYNCSYELISSIEHDNNIFGCVGYVDVNTKNHPTDLFVLYQHGEYMFEQCLKRNAQSKLTKKVNCLSGCNQILRISEETCGNAILSKFYYLPKDTDDLFTHIRSVSSEDRNHVCIMLSMYPYAKTVQNLNAIAHTNVPTTLRVFLSQRRRWSLGANLNDLMMLFMPNINIFERIGAFVNITIYSLSPFVFIATIFFLKSLFTQPSYLMLLLSIIMIIPYAYGFLIPVFIKPMIFKKALYYYFSFIFFILFGSTINLLTYFYSLAGMDNFKWGKTRTIEDNLFVNIPQEFPIETNTDDIITESSNSIEISNSSNNYWYDNSDLEFLKNINEKDIYASVNKKNKTITEGVV